MREEYEKLTVTKQPKKQMKAAKSKINNTIIMEGGNVNDECVESFMEQLKAKVKSEVGYSDFQILEEDLGKDLRIVGRFKFPLRLAPISNRIKDGFGDITSCSSQITEGKSGEKMLKLKNVDTNIEVPEDCLHEAEYFCGKPLSTGLLR
ncbi:hypothetical protein J1N35_001503 [Gossypium stocksii]|uniref:Uncharacterized protein n=1 Tax=Gossypium stocksii TaxID=47602 RepID=A0A9D4AJP1_9ROSI|nr:hypothetical protein J1N35_001503 [Gossypium stocksii]